MVRSSKTFGNVKYGHHLKISKTIKMDFDKGLDRKGTSCAKWDFLKEYFGRDDVLPMWVADSDWKTCEPVIEALKRE